MLDSSPVALPPVRPSLKRSASVASLQTPRERTISESIGSESDEEAEVISKGHKKRRRSEVNETDEEEAFWMDSKARSDGEGTSKSKSISPAPPLLYRRRVNTTGVAPVSPPPSNRKTKTVMKMVSPVALPSIPGSPPVTPEAKFPVRDSPNNPFLDASPTNDSGIESTDTTPGPRTPQQERPTVTYVFRGPSDPNFSPAPHCPPKLLFPGARRRSARKRGSPRLTLADEMRKANSKSRQRSVSVSGSDSEDGGYEKPIVPVKLNFAAEREEKARATSSKR
ncbi:hypothetical protein Hypma_000376 [Hypsizygus marmoreus]|uniref:Uncharacterized protein n=1 Tax=Hypsizygus marmoreus TaxID=39966 RepID=A0A369JB18_HYPMA|nr:hypothetical protein Hypma_000376 [Hypsizygus marmoreus]